MNLTNKTNLFDLTTRIEKLPEKLSALEIKKVMFIYNAGEHKTDIEIDEWDGTTVMFKSESADAINPDKERLMKIINQTIKSRESTEENESFKRDFIFVKDRIYKRPHEILSSPSFKQYSSGRFYIKNDAAKLLNAMDQRIQKFALRENAEEFYSEPLWHQTELSKFGYSPDNDNLLKIKNLDGIYWQNAICDSIWESLENSIIPEFKVYSSVGICSRTEKNQTFFFERMNAFHMREIVAVGNKDEIVSFRKRAIEFVSQLANELSLNYSLEEANDPFFIENINKLGKTDYDLPDIIKIEFRPHLYDNKSLACASFNIHGDFFSKKFNYKSPDGKTLWTSCAAFGLERWLWAIFVQYGLELENWPESLRQLVKNS